MMADLEPIPVTVAYLDDARACEGPGWYYWETEYPEEGYFFHSTSERLTVEQLQKICPQYVEEQNAISPVL